MNAYTRLLRFEDSIFKNKNFKRAAIGLVTCHLRNEECYTMEKASAMVHKLIREFPNDAEVHGIAFQLWTKKQKWLLAARSALWLQTNTGSTEAVAELKGKLHGVAVEETIQAVLDRHLV